MKDSKNNKLGELISMNGRLQEIQDLINKYKEDNPDESVGEFYCITGQTACRLLPDRSGQQTTDATRLVTGRLRPVPAFQTG